MDQLIESLLLFASVAAIVGFAIENVKGVLDSEGNTDDYQLYAAVLICVVFNITIIEDIASTELQQAGAFGGKIQDLLYMVRPWIDNVISGAAMAGGAGKLLKRINRERKKVTDAAAK
tara:strand:- start:708 stop:1061 length:354 start_codon:yes stop_codon:yes gene_type:complete